MPSLQFFLVCPAGLVVGADPLTDGAGLSSSLAEGSGVPVMPGSGAADCDGEGVWLSSMLKDTGPVADTVPLSGLTRSRRSPAGSPADVFPPELTLTSTLLDVLTQVDSILPLAALLSPCPLSPSSRSHDDHRPLSALRVRKSTVPVTLTVGNCTAAIPARPQRCGAVRVSAFTGPGLASAEVLPAGLPVAE